MYLFDASGSSIPQAKANSTCQSQRNLPDHRHKSRIAAVEKCSKKLPNFPGFCLTIILRGTSKMPMKRRFYHVNGQMMAYEEDGVTKDFLTDHLGSITAEIDQNQNRTFEARYSAYGIQNWSTGTGCGFGWVGSYGYRATGLFHMSHYVRARHYSYVTGNWSTVDPLWPDESAYGYVGCRSPRAIDPTGKYKFGDGCKSKDPECWKKGGIGGIFGWRTKTCEELLKVVLAALREFQTTCRCAPPEFEGKVIFHFDQFCYEDKGPGAIGPCWIKNDDADCTSSFGGGSGSCPTECRGECRSAYVPVDKKFPLPPGPFFHKGGYRVSALKGSVTIKGRIKQSFCLPDPKGECQ